jgi:hypothetical protein
MKSALRLFLAVFITLTFAGLVFAQAPGKPAAPEKMEKKMDKPEKMDKAEKPKATTVTGELTSVDAKAGTLTVKAKDKETSLTADSKAAKGALEKVKVGDMVKVSYTEKDGKKVATKIDKTKGEAKGKTEAKGKSMEKKSETQGMEEPAKPKTK